MTAESGFQISGNAAENYQRLNAVIMHPFVAEVIRRAAVGAGDAVLDVACGTGFVTRSVAPIAGPTGRVAGLDLNAGMIATARALPTPPGAPIDWHEGSALELPFADGEFRVVICQQGVQFFPDPARALAEMARVAAPDARIVVSLWASPEHQTYFRAQVAGLQVALGDGAAPIQRAFGVDPTLIAAGLTASGCRDVQVELFTTTVSLPPLETFAAAQISTLPVAPAFAALDATRQQAYVDGMVQALAQYRTASGYDCPAASWMVTARR